MRGKGIGKKVIGLVFEKAKDLGIKAIHLEVVPTNLRAYEFYDKIGFKDRKYARLTKTV